jgi:hypothetical protein
MQMPSSHRRPVGSAGTVVLVEFVGGDRHDVGAIVAEMRTVLLAQGEEVVVLSACERIVECK